MRPTKAKKTVYEKGRWYKGMHGPCEVCKIDSPQWVYGIYEGMDSWGNSILDIKSRKLSAGRTSVRGALLPLSSLEMLKYGDAK